MTVELWAHLIPLALAAIIGIALVWKRVQVWMYERLETEKAHKERATVRVLFLDLDGTVRYSSHESGFINKSKDVVVYPGAKREIHRFIDAGWKVFYVSNQGGIAAGYTTIEDFTKGVVETANQLGVEMVVACCPHDINADSFCRKPRPGMVAKLIFGLEEDVRVSECLFVGDRPEDLECAKACGIPFMWAEEWRSGKFPVDGHGPATPDASEGKQT